MNSADSWLVHDHSLYEELLTQSQDAADIGDWEAVDHIFKEMINSLKQHMTLEEEVLYPAYEARFQTHYSPTEALREEHSKIVRFVRDMLQVIKSRDSEHVLDCLYRLEDLMIKHHEKEEDIFLPMASIILEDNRDELTEKLHTFDVTKSTRKWDI
jgi:hemerythrin-like domain-containing protein